MNRTAYHIATCLFCLLLFIAAYSIVDLYFLRGTVLTMNSPGVKFDRFWATDGTILKVTDGKMETVNADGRFHGSRKGYISRYLPVALYIACLILSGVLVQTIYLEKKVTPVPKPIPKPEPVAS